MIIFDLVTLFPDSVSAYLSESILGRAQKRKLIKVKLHNPRDYSTDKHRKVDSRPYGGGPGMVMMLQPLLVCLQSLAKSIGKEEKKRTEVIVFSPAGEQFDQKTAKLLAKKRRLILFCGRYEGIDRRLIKILKNEGWKVREVSVGPYVLTGGEIPAAAVVDAVSREVKGVLGKEESIEEKRQGVGVPVFTRPEEFIWHGKKYRVPKELLSGNHLLVEKWRLEHKAK